MIPLAVLSRVRTDDSITYQPGVMNEQK